jgi:omega-3 fatty acid desaturase (delta-15 desaturase)
MHSRFAFWSVVKLYWMPYLVFVAWLSLVTYLQHTDEKVSYFRGKSWSYLTGALSTVDRTYGHLIDPFELGYGFLLDNIHHNISDGHVIHHLFFTTIPHYHLIEATKAVLPRLGDKRVWDPTPVPRAFYNSITRCHYVDDHKEVCEYQQNEGYQMPLFEPSVPVPSKKKV